MTSPFAVTVAWHVVGVVTAVSPETAVAGGGISRDDVGVDCPKPNGIQVAMSKTRQDVVKIVRFIPRLVQESNR